MNRDINSIAKEIDCADFLFKLNFYKIRIDLDIKTWDDFVLKIFPKLYLFDSGFLVNNQLTSLNGCPKEFPGGFDCSDNELTSLEGAPQKVSGRFDCSNNKLISLEGAPEYIGYHFTFSYNQLTSLKGAPWKVGGEIFCTGNYNLPTYKIKAYKAYLKLFDSEKVPLTKDGHYCPTDEWENKFK